MIWSSSDTSLEDVVLAAGDVGGLLVDVVVGRSGAARPRLADSHRPVSRPLLGQGKPPPCAELPSCYRVSSRSTVSISNRSRTLLAFYWGDLRWWFEWGNSFWCTRRLFFFKYVPSYFFFSISFGIETYNHRRRWWADGGTSRSLRFDYQSHTLWRVATVLHTREPVSFLTKLLPSFLFNVVFFSGKSLHASSIGFFFHFQSP